MKILDHLLGRLDCIVCGHRLDSGFMRDIEGRKICIMCFARLRDGP